MTNLDYFTERTDQKLRFASIHLDELTNHSRRSSGDDFERCHLESFLFHFYGASDAFLQELNIYYQCELAIDKVCRKNIRKALKRKGLESPEFVELEQLETDADSYFGIAKELRNHSTHRGGIPIQHYFNGPSYLVHPITRKELGDDTVEMLARWLALLTELLSELRVSARSRCV